MRRRFIRPQAVLGNTETVKFKPIPTITRTVTIVRRCIGMEFFSREMCVFAVVGHMLLSITRHGRADLPTITSLLVKKTEALFRYQ